jgi:hypothetical protein
MKVSKNKLQEIIILYLNDIQDYGTQEEFILAESALSPYKQLLTENKKPVNQLIQEMVNNSKHPDHSSDIIFDFLTYMKESQ